MKNCISPTRAMRLTRLFGKTVRIVVFLLSFLSFTFAGYSQLSSTLDGNPAHWVGYFDGTYPSKAKKIIKDAQQTDDNQFTNGTKDITPLPQWSWVLGQTNNKGDILNAGAVILGNRLYFFGDRYAINGDAQIGFWLLLGGAKPNGDGTSASNFLGDHAVGDILILSNFTNGGGTPAQQIFKWVGTGGDAGGGVLENITNSSSHDAFVNDVERDVPSLAGWTYQSKQGAAGKYVIGSFFEGYVDLPAEFGDAELCNASFLMETRNSQSLQASLQDFAWGDFALKPDCSISTSTSVVLLGEPVTFSVPNVAGDTYAWSTSPTGGVVIANPSSASTNITFSQPGSFTISITVTSTLGCQSTCTKNINVQALPAEFSLSPTSYCLGEPGLGTVATSQSETGVTYKLYKVGTPDVLITSKAGTGNPLLFTGLSAGEYYVIAVNDITLQETNSQVPNAVVAVFGSPTASAVATNITCYGLNNGAITLTVGGNGTPAYSFDWSNGASSQNLSGLAPNTYSVIVTDANGCVATAEATVIEPTDVTASAVATAALCNGGNGSVNLTVAGGTPGYSFLWSNGATTEDLSAVKAGTYSVTVTDANGCTETAEATVTEPTDVTASAVATAALCNGGNGSVDLTVAGGTPGYSFLWSNGATSEDLSAVKAGTYSVTVTDANGCTETAEATVTEPTDVTASAVATNPLCNGGTGSVNLTVSGGVPDYTFLWSNGATTEDLAAVVAGTYSVTVTDANGCTETASATVINPAAFTCRVSSTPEICTGSSTTYSVSTTGGTGATYEWTVTGTYGSWNGSGSSITVSSGANLGSYTVKVKVTSTNGCVTTCETTTQVVNCTVCTYTQGAYGSPGGKMCFDDAPNNLTQASIKAAINKAGPDGVVGSEVFGLTSSNRYFTLTLDDVIKPYEGTDGKQLTANPIFKMLPGGGNSQPIGVYAGGARYATTASWSVVPLDNRKSTYGKIRNTLLAQTIPLFVSIQNSKDLGALQLQNYVVITRDVECGTKNLVGSPMEFQFPKTVIDFLNSGYGNTVNDLYRLANAYLGGSTPGNLNIGDVANAVDRLNNAFDGCRAAIGWQGEPSVQRTITAAPAAAIQVATKGEVEDGTVQNGAIKAYPNPFTDRVLFTIQPKVSGQAQLDIFDMTGRKIQTPFNGYLKAGQKQTVEVKMNTTSDGIIIYRLNTSDGQTSGRLMRLK